VAGTLFAVPFDERRQEVTGGAVPIVEGVRRAASGGTGVAHFTVSDTGTLIFVPGPVASTSVAPGALALIDRNGNAEPLKLPPGAYESPRMSPDGRRVAYATDDGKDAIVWIYELAGTSVPRRLTFGGRNRFPIWSADGQRIAFQSDRDGDLGIFWQRADGTGTAERLTKPDQGTAHVPEAWSPTGERFSFSLIKESDTSLWMFSLPDKKAAPFGQVRSPDLLNSAFSPDGRWVAYAARFGGGNVFVEPFPATGAIYQISKDNVSHHPLWSPDGKELSYRVGSGTQVLVSVSTQPSFAVGNPAPVPGRFVGMTVGIPRNLDFTPDGKRFIAVTAASGPESEASAAPEIQIVLNWFEELKRLVPTK
jgi:Tol biopolymer transport system component